MELPHLPVEVPTLWNVDDPEPGGDRAGKHALVAATRDLVDAVALVDATDLGAAELERLAGAVGHITAQVRRAKDFSARGLALAGGDDGKLVERSPFAGRSNPLAPPMHLHFDGTLTTGWAVWPAAYEGPPACLHGGFVAAAFDDLLGFAQLASGSAGYTGTLTVRMRRPTPLGERIDYEAGVRSHRDRKILCWGTASAGGELLAEAEILFISPRRPDPA